MISEFSKGRTESPSCFLNKRIQDDGRQGMVGVGGQTGDLLFPGTDDTDVCLILSHVVAAVLADIVTTSETLVATIKYKAEDLTTSDTTALVKHCLLRQHRCPVLLRIQH